MWNSTIIFMINSELSSIFEDLADMEDIEENHWESLAYRKVAKNISMLTEDVLDLYHQKKLRQIGGVGSAIEKKIVEYIETGKISKHESLKEKYNIDFQSLRRIQGLGPKRISLLYLTLGIKNLDELMAAIEDNRVSKVPGFGAKSQEALKKAIEFFMATGAGRIPLALCYDDIQNFLMKLKSSDKFSRLHIAGSTRRMKDTVGDIDILSSSTNPRDAAEFFQNLTEVKHVIAGGDTKVSVVLSLGLNCDLRIIDDKSFGAGLQYFTGSKEHNIRLRDIAINKGMKLNEYGLFRGERVVASETEEGIYKELGLQWIPPELRENMGEVEAALENNIPRIVEFDHIYGDLHTHTNASDGHSSIEEMVNAAIKLGHKFIALTEHSKSLKIANGLDEKRFRTRNRDIDRYNENTSSIRILKGVELEILKDGTFDLSKKLLEEMDVIIGAVHQSISEDLKTNTTRFTKAIESGLLTAIAHPTGRLLGIREPYPLDFDAVFQSCADNNVAVEINGFPTRSDLPYDLVKKARSYKVSFTLGSDAHNTEQLKYLKFATAIARRGWLESKNILNTDVHFMEKINKNVG